MVMLEGDSDMTQLWMGVVLDGGGPRGLTHWCGTYVLGEVYVGGDDAMFPIRPYATWEVSGTRFSRE